MSRATAVLTPASECQRPKDDLTGRRFGRLIAMEFVGRSKHHQAHWRCRCDCGKYSVAQDGVLKSGETQSCGCLRRAKTRAASLKHGHCTNNNGSKTYAVLANMKDRCENPKHKGFSDYGGRGISVCQRWHSFNSFLADMGLQPPGLQLDRRDNNGDYEPTNCRWATRIEQQNNTRTTQFLVIDGLRDSRANHARRHRIDIQRLMYISRWASKANIELDESVGIPLSWLEETATLRSLRKSKSKI